MELILDESILQPKPKSIKRTQYGLKNALCLSSVFMGILSFGLGYAIKSYFTTCECHGSF